MSTNNTLTVATSIKPTLRTADKATQHEYSQAVDAPLFNVDHASWRQMVSWMWMDMLRDAETIDTSGDDLKTRDLVVQAGTRFLHKLRQPVASGAVFGRKYTLWEVISINTPRQGQHFECFYSDTKYRVLPPQNG